MHPGQFSSLCSVTLGATAEAAFEEQEVLMPAGKHPDLCSHSRGRQRQGEDQEGQVQVPGGSRNLAILPKRSGLWAVGSMGDVGGKGGEAVVFRNLLGKGPGFFLYVLSSKPPLFIIKPSCFNFVRFIFMFTCVCMCVCACACNVRS